MIKARRITQPCTDLKVVNAARVSMAVTHDVYDTTKDTKLINYLASHKHWTPFSHNRDTIFFQVESRAMYNAFIQALLLGLTVEEKSAMVIQENLNIDGENYIAVKTSLYGWVNVIKRFSESYIANDGYTIPLIVSVLSAKYPVSACAYLEQKYLDLFDNVLYERNQNILEATIPYLEQKMFDVTFYEHVPIFVARQRFKHMVMNTYNEVSKRYVDDIPEVYFPDIWRLRPDKSIKQGSGGDHPDTIALSKEYEEFCKTVLNYYDKLINVDKVAPEQARMVLPQSMMIEYYVTANMDAWDRFLVQRQYSGAQKEIRDLANIVSTEMSSIRNSINFIRNSGGDYIRQLEDIGVF